MAQSLSSWQKSEFLKLIILIFHVKKIRIFLKKSFIKEYQFGTTFFDIIKPRRIENLQSQ